MGLIMLILIGTVPTAYALNHAVGVGQVQDFAAVSEQAIQSVNHYIDPSAVVGDTRDEVTDYIRTHQFKASTMLAMQQLIGDIEHEVGLYKALAKVPDNQQANVRNDMYLISEAIRIMQKSGKPVISAADTTALGNYKKHLDLATKFIPTWVKVAVALALGLGTMVGWKRIVVTVGEKIGKEHLTYAQGAAAELVAAGTIMAADFYGLPVSTTHVLSSGVAGTMAANRSGLQWATVRNVALAWIFTLPAAALLAGSLFWLFSRWA
jgi:PiT family inorganic phosphate transporter